MRLGPVDRLILFGGGDCLAQLALAAPLPVTVVTAPRHHREGLVLDKQTLGDFLNSNKIKHVVVEHLKDFDLPALAINAMGLSLGSAWIFGSSHIEMFGGRLLNAHGSRLPADRGGGGFSWRILMGDAVGVSLVHQIDKSLDTGAILEYEDYIYPASCRRPADYYEYSCRKYVPFLLSVIERIKEGAEFEKCMQPEYLSTYWPRLSTSVHGFIDWSWPCDQIDRFICAFDEPYAGAMTYFNGAKVHLKSSRLHLSEGNCHHFQAGLVFRVSREGIFVAADRGTVIIQRVVDENGLDIIGSIKTGYRFHTPADCISQALMTKVSYGPS
jgi:methionyl-tRNA formyltransferase